MTCDRYGRFYWCEKTPLSPDGEIYLFADAVEHWTGEVVR